MALKRVYKLLFLLLILWPGFCAAGQPVWLIDIKGAIGPATSDHVVRGLGKAAEASAQLVVLRIDTPGGLDSATRQIDKAILASPIPVVGYVSPSGARAASAGTYILYACHLAAMAPATNLGAATPVQIGAPGLPSMPGQKDSDGEEDKFKGTTAMERKIINDAVAHIEGLAKLRGRNHEWAAKAVREGVSLTADKALEMDVINVVAEDIDKLLSQIDGREVSINGSSVVLELKDSQIYHYQADWRTQFLSVITNPNVAYILMLVGIYGLIIEFYNPGLGVPGVVGAVCLVLALYAFQVLPVSYAGLALIILGIALMAAEAFAPSFGILGFGGIVAFIIGSIILMDTEVPGYKIAWPIIAAFTVMSAGLMVLALGMILKTRRRGPVSGLDHLVGSYAMVESVEGGEPMIGLEGELWQVSCDQPLQLNDKVRVNAAQGVVLNVSKE